MKVVVLLLGLMLILIVGFFALESLTDFIIENRRIEEESTVPKRKKEPLKKRLRRWLCARKKRK